MSTPQRPKPAQPILSILSSRWDLFWPGLLETLGKRFGRPDDVSDLFDFTETSYYDEELGTPIRRRIIAFEQLVPPEALPVMKLFTNELEGRSLDSSGNRIFNLDPGLLQLERLVLATGKEFTHRIYLRSGIWAEVTLIFQKGGWRALPWTYPDYAGTLVQAILTRIRDRYKDKLKSDLPPANLTSC
jgi:hypothetical protein